ncbi:hypothetical protein MAM1_0088d04791 [Mucor ambiguus]|uniref:HTH La-type RNA-binding domain-containing protein n=1 Tax=Mucor ambiguus TaxID=91626 RepID=A0A0C9M6C1_9FUNG|nr:hypothetical protein MAM1_0088d04791 [Mucor ambiguus]
MTVSNIEPKNQAKEEQPASSSTAIATKKDFIKKKAHNKYNNNNNNNNRMRANYSKHNSNNRDDYARYYPNQPLKSDYPMPYVYYYPPPANMYYPPLDTGSSVGTSAAAVATPSAIIPSTRDEDDLEIIVHDESMNNVSSVDTRRSSSSDQMSQMDADLYVPISLVANFRRVREWTTDVDLIVQTLRDSSAVTVDESGTRVKPNISVQRNTVILRDVPECTQDEINDLLKELNSPPVQSIKQDIGNMWYFTFESEDDALKLLLGVRGKSFKGQAIAARMKSEPVLRVQSRTIATTGAAAASAPSPPSFTHQNIKAEGQYPSAATATTTTSHELPVTLPELPPVYTYGGAGMNGSNFYYPSYPSYNSNKRNNYGHVPFRYNNNHQPHPKYNNTYQQQQHQQQHYHYQPPASVANRHEGSRSFIDNQKNFQVGGRSTRGGYNTNKPRYFRTGPDANTADSNVVENGLNKLTMNDTVSHPPTTQPHKQAQYNIQQQRQPSTTYQNNKQQYHTKSGNNSKYASNNNNSNIYQSQHQQPNVPYTKPNYTTNDAAVAPSSSSNTTNTNVTAINANTTHKNSTRNSTSHSNPPQKQQQSHPASVQQLHQQQSKKKNRHSNSQQQHDNNSNTHHAGGGKIDNKKKKSNGKLNAQESKENARQAKQEEVDLKPTHFPPLPNQQSPTVVAAPAEQPSLPARSVADIVKSTVAPRPKKQMPKKEQQPVPSSTTPAPATAAAAAATPTPAPTTPTEQKETNTFSYADMLKKKDH